VCVFECGKKPGPVSFLSVVIWVLLYRGLGGSWFRVSLWLLTSAAWGKLMHILNGNIFRSRLYALFICFIVIGIPMAILEIYMSKRHGNRAFTFTVKDIFGWFKWYLIDSRHSWVWGALALIISPVLFTICFILSIGNMLYLEFIMEMEYRKDRKSSKVRIGRRRTLVTKDMDIDGVKKTIVSFESSGPHLTLNEGPRKRREGFVFQDTGATLIGTDGEDSGSDTERAPSPTPEQ